MKIDTNDVISVTEANNKGISKLVSEANEGRDVVLFRSNKPVAAIVGIDKLERLQAIDEAEDDLRLFAVAVVRAATDTGQRVSLEDAAARFGIDLDSLDDDSDESDED